MERAGEGSLSGDSQFVVISRKDLHNFVKEAQQLKELVSIVITPEYLKAVEYANEASFDIGQLQGNLQQCQNALKIANEERDHWRSRYEALVEDMQQLKQEKLSLRCDVQELNSQMSQQSEYCASLGAAVCTLLWRVSRCEESIQTILAGSKVDEFLQMVCTTLESYLATYKEQVPQELADETQFVLAICGIITNVAASSLGRDFLMRNSHGPALVDTFIRVLAEAPSKTCTKMKSLILMGLYNLSINQKGMKHLSGQQAILALLAWIIKDETAKDTRLNSLRLAQSLLYEQTNTNVIHESAEVFTPEFLQQLSEDPCTDIRETAIELVQDIRNMCKNVDVN